MRKWLYEMLTVGNFCNSTLYGVICLSHCKWDCEHAAKRFLIEQDSMIYPCQRRRAYFQNFMHCFSHMKAFFLLVLCIFIFYGVTIGNHKKAFLCNMPNQVSQLPNKRWISTAISLSITGWMSIGANWITWMTNHGIRKTQIWLSQSSSWLWHIRRSLIFSSIR